MTRSKSPYSITWHSPLNVHQVQLLCPEVWHGILDANIQMYALPDVPPHVSRLGELGGALLGVFAGGRGARAALWAGGGLGA